MGANQDLMMVHRLTQRARFGPHPATLLELGSVCANTEKLRVLLLTIAQHQSEFPLEKLPESLLRARCNLSNAITSWILAENEPF